MNIFKEKYITVEAPYSIPKQVWKDPHYFIAFGFGTGALPMAPGTWGTMAAIPIYLLIADLPLFLYIILLLILFLFGIYLCNKISHELNIHDHPGIVWDEIVGFLITMTAMPKSWNWILLGFVLFRVFDITKPWPIARVDKRLRNGFGIMADDALAGLYSWLSVYLLFI